MLHRVSGLEVMIGLLLVRRIKAEEESIQDWGPLPSGLSQNYWTSSSSYSLLVVKVLVNRIQRLLRGVLISILVLLAGNVELMLGESCPFLEGLVQRHVLPLLGYDFPPLALPHLLSHLYPPSFGVVYFGGHEDLRLGLFSALDSEESSDYPYLLDWLGLRDLGLTRLLLFLLLLHLGGWHLDVALDWLLPVKFVHLAVRLRHHLRSFGSAPLAASGGLLLHRGLYQRGAVSSNKVC